MSSNLTARDDDANIGTTILAILGSLTSISAVFVAARIYVRVMLLRNLGLDDYLIVLALVTC